MSLLGEAGLTRMAQINHEKACDLADRLSSIDGVELLNETFFNEFTLRLPVVDALVEKNVLGGVPLSRIATGSHEDLLLVCAMEIVSDEDIVAYEQAMKEVLS